MFEVQHNGFFSTPKDSTEYFAFQVFKTATGILLMKIIDRCRFPLQIYYLYFSFLLFIICFISLLSDSRSLNLFKPLVSFNPLKIPNGNLFFSRGSRRKRGHEMGLYYRERIFGDNFGQVVSYCFIEKTELIMNIFSIK